MSHQQMFSTPISFHLVVSLMTHTFQQMVPVHDSVFLTAWAIRTLKNTETVKVIHKAVKINRKFGFLDNFLTEFIRDISVRADPPTSCRNMRMNSDDVRELLDFHKQKQIIDELIEMHEKEQDIQELESLDPIQSEDRMTVLGI
ncbi:hypothetical protein TNCV_1305381 [Trichonephila clavipes]|nr:hypothetical protein TNCV_1305381 [Trichonephila clavipes]